jgi:hypothetical protein
LIRKRLIELIQKHSPKHSKRKKGGMAKPRSIGSVLPALAGNLFGKRSLAFGGLLEAWEGLVGTHLASAAFPLKLVFPTGRRAEATLHIRVRGAAATEIQHQEPQLIQKINQFFGYGAVARLKLIQAPPKSLRSGVSGSSPFSTLPSASASRPPVREADRRKVAVALAGVEDQELKEVLARFGHALLQKRN